MIRPSNTLDTPSILQLHRAAFGEAEGDSVANLVRLLYQDSSAKPWVSLVKEIESKLIGHILFTPVSVKTQSQPYRGFMLSPLAIVPDFQKQGFGSELIECGLNEVQQAQADFAVVYGNPDYYGRAGFVREHRIEAPQKLARPYGWQAMEFKEGLLEKLYGKLLCPRSFDAPEYW